MDQIKMARDDALQDLGDARDALGAVQELVGMATTPTVTVDRRKLWALFQMLNSQIDRSLQQLKTTNAPQ